jgi:hypothetical protein
MGIHIWFPIVIKEKNNYGVVSTIKQNYRKEPLNVQQASVQVQTFDLHKYVYVRIISLSYYLDVKSI